MLGPSILYILFKTTEIFPFKSGTCKSQNRVANLNLNGCITM